ncbi:MAG: UDP-galactopyranose mutase [Chlorobi bacterium]|nr:UDP-galactopyranose mutase [Chlorobiota bacterium]
MSWITEFEYVVVGGGLAGTIIAEHIARVLNKKVLIIERNLVLGGHCYDYVHESGIRVHKYGPHLFHTPFKEVWEYLSQFTEWDYYQHRVMGWIDGKYVPIPFNFNTLYALLPTEFARRLESKLLEKYDYGSRIPIKEFMDADDEDLRFLANFVYEKIFYGYTSKQWGRKPEEISADVLARVPIVLSRDDRYFNDQYQGVPKRGYTTMIRNIATHKNIFVLLNTHHKELIKLDNGRIYLDGQEFKGLLIYTGSIDDLFDYKFGHLPYRSLRFRWQVVHEKQFQPVAQVNFPLEYEYTRITEYKHIHPLDVPYTVVAYEFPEEYEYGKNLPFYPLFTEGGQEAYLKYQELAKKYKNLILLGRLAEYRYYDMDDTVKRSMEIFEEKIL